MIGPRAASVAAALAACGLAAGCDSGSPAAFEPTAALQSDVNAVTRFAAERQWKSAQQALAKLRADLAAAVAAGAVGEQRARTIRADVGAVAADLAEQSAASAPSTSPPSTTSPPAAVTHAPTSTRPSAPTTHHPPPPHHHRHGKHGHGHGDGGD